jgi:large subunit GTPase 1
MSKQRQGGLGKALKNKLEKKRVYVGDNAPIFYQESEVNEADKKKKKMQSVLEQNNLAEYLQVAEMSQEDFHANRNIKFSEIREEVKNKKIILVDADKKRKKLREEENVRSNALKGLQVPRRPTWQKTDSKEALEKLETEAYLTWRRKLAQVE